MKYVKLHLIVPCSTIGINVIILTIFPYAENQTKMIILSVAYI